MKSLLLYCIPLFTILVSSNYLRGQDKSDQVIVKQVYEVLQNKNVTSNEIAALTNHKNWDKIEDTKSTNHSISLRAIIKNEWQSILFKNLSFQLSGNNKIIVTGIVNGRKSTECEYVSTRFKHYWSLKDGKVIGFLE
ncbi:hypothetical protein RM545_06380 [Zunongwangia sp. F260]|uniref:Nuclear transport factor 2 family protein n=1 Tax=Autumnicola lenta TaxID=3075593 RepID=A0ABU3CIX7_9FLAO|nr:hypothetical protein [Zunongwangia sp. F260]MDT0646311.1 hypothetical protein [Zunongwangia sp. F260]